MAGIAWEGKDGDLAKITFRNAAGRQQSLRLGRCTKRTAQSALIGFERVWESYRTGSTLHPDGVRWLEAIDDRLHARVAKLGLCEPRKPAETVTLSGLLDRFKAAATVQASTRAAYKQATDSLRSHFGADTPLAAITNADADGWRKAIADPVKVKDDEGKESTKKLAPATVAKRTIIAKGIFRKAVRWGLIPASPFADLRSGSQSNPDRAHYVAVETVQAILDACPDDQWRAIVALSRFAGLRCPSEIALLRWGDVNWERGRLMVRSPKTAGHEGHAVRVVPIAPELRPILQRLYDAAEERAEPVVPRLRDATTNLRTHFERIIAKAGEKPWPRLFHNMRASCATDWVERFPAHTVAGWLGHSPLIAARHYLQVRDAHFDAAAGIEKAAANPATDPATDPATHARPSETTDEHATTETPEIPADLVGCGVGCDPVENEVMGATGLEPVTSRV